MQTVKATRHACCNVSKFLSWCCRVQTAANTPKGGGQGDPIFTGFDGRVFEFLGNPESFYNIISERHHQVR